MQLKTVALGIAMLVLAFSGYAQYEENPMKGIRWTSISGGLNTANNISWQAMGTYSKRGEVILSQVRVGYTQEFIEAANDTFTFRKNRLMETGWLFGDCWGGRKWYTSGAVGFGLNVYLYAAKREYKLAYLTGVTIGVPIQLEAGYRLSKNLGVNVTAIANWNFRSSYAGVHIGVWWQLKKN